MRKGHYGARRSAASLGGSTLTAKFGCASQPSVHARRSGFFSSNKARAISFHDLESWRTRRLLDQEVGVEVQLAELRQQGKDPDEHFREFQRREREADEQCEVELEAKAWGLSMQLTASFCTASFQPPADLLFGVLARSVH